MTQTKAILGEKLGMTQIFDDARAIPVTVIKAGPCYVGQIKTEENDGYQAYQLIFAAAKPQQLNKPQQGHFAKHGETPGKHVVEVRTDDAGDYTPGQEITVEQFQAGDKTDVIGVSKGKGFAGVIKRHGFHGLRASHGVEKKHRSPGSIGACATPSRVFRGMKMAGQMGNQRVTILNLEVIRADAERNLLLVKGAVPGPAGSLVMIRSAVKDGSTGGGA